MFHPRRFGTLHVISVCATLALLLTLFPHTTQTRAARRRSPSAPPGPGEAYTQTNLVSDVPGLARFLDPLIVNPWGMTLDDDNGFPAVVNLGTNSATLYGTENAFRSTGSIYITIPGGPPTAAALNGSNPFNRGNNFMLTNGAATGPATVVFVSRAGEITAWGPVLGSNTATLVLSAPGHVYTGVAIADDPFHSTAPGRYLYAADFANGKIDVYNSSFVLQTSGFAFTIPGFPPDYHPYNIQNLGGILYITYARRGLGGEPQKGAGLGHVRVFNADSVQMPGGFSGGEMNAPWGVAIAPGNFGTASGHLLVANTGDGRIISHAQGPLLNEAGEPLVIEGLHGLMTPRPDCCTGVGDKLIFTAGVGNEAHGLMGRLRATTANVTSLIQFSSASFATGEAGDHIDVSVTRSGNVSGAATVNFNTLDVPGAGRASQKSDYEMALGTLTFNPGETSKTFRVLVVNDNFVEGPETIDLALSNATGAGIGSLNRATLTVADDDSSPPASNPIDDASFFVRQHYLDFLNREPDAAGLQFWTNQITSCGDAQCREVRRINVSAAFFLSIEFRNTGLLAYMTNRAAFGASALDGPTPVLYGQFLHDVQMLQKNFVVGQPGAEAQLETNKQAFFAYTVARPEFVVFYGTFMTPDQFVDALYARAGVTPSASERNAAVAEFGSAIDTSDQSARARVLRRVAENPALASAEFNRATVTMEYFGYLRRDPDEQGFNFWRAKLEQFGGDLVAAEMVKAFISSTEYRRRFGAN